ncbi:MAG: NADH-quinone oxidoreductase subunit N [Planctomycetaceae bacterium]|nr:NADH-quinone oxidoreductase subunit N [Planctomycetaceae bacterium]
MNLHDLVSQLIIDSTGSASLITPDSSLRAFLPELVICATVLAMLFVRLFRVGRYVDMFWIALAGSIAALYFAAPWDHLGAVLTADQAAHPAAVTRMEIFTGMLVYDTFSVYVRSALFLFAILFVIFTRLSGIPDHEDSPDIYTLVLGATLGMCLMVTANHLLMVFMAVEMASVPSYVLAGILKGRRQASEAALKYSVYGAGAAGVMLYGISLVAGILNTAHIPTIALTLAEKFSGGLSAVPSGELMVLALGALLISVGLAFKLSAVPFHFWCPDVFEGATAEVNAFLSVASKAAALALLVRVALGMGVIAPTGFAPGERWAKTHQNAPATTPTSTDKTTDLFYIAQEPVTAAGAAAAADSTAEPAKLPAMQSLAPVRSFTAKLIAFFAIITCTFGNLAAYGQTNIKRLLAYSTIAHAGYMMMPVAAVVAMAGIDNAGAARGIAGLAIYIAVYLFMNLGAFAVVAFLRNAMRSEEIADYAGLVRRCPLTVVCFSLILFGLIGLPPLSGFIGKFAIFASLVDGWRAVEAAGQPGFYLLLLLIVGGINTAISLFYYLRVVKVMTIDDEPADRPPLVYSDVSLAGAYLWLITLPTAGLIVAWDWLSEMADAAARNLIG